jgi:hypothetical protein
MFRNIGLKFIDPDYEDNLGEEEKELQRIRKQTVKINNKDEKPEGEKGGCCGKS